MGRWVAQGLAFELPKGWDGRPDGTALRRDAKLPMSLVVQQETVPPTMDARAYAAQVMGLMKQETMGYQVLIERELTVAGLAAILRQHAFTHQKAKVGQVQLLLVRKGRGISVTLGYPPEAAEQGLQTAEALFAGISLP